MAFPVPHFRLLAAKYVAVVTVTLLTGLMNLVAMGVTLYALQLDMSLLGGDGFTISLAAVLNACLRLKGESWYQECAVWLYRGAWQEWAPHPARNVGAAQSSGTHAQTGGHLQARIAKDKALFPGPDPREFWQRAEDRNHATAQLFDALGLAEYEAIEGFVRWKGDLDTVL